MSLENVRPSIEPMRGGCPVVGRARVRGGCGTAVHHVESAIDYAPSRAITGEHFGRPLALGHRLGRHLTDGLQDFVIQRVSGSARAIRR